MVDALPGPAEPELVRKLATIVSADVAGFSRLMAEDEERTLRIFRGYSAIFAAIVAQHRGRIFNTAGDAILAEFASAVEAVRAATEIQSALRTRNDQLPAAQQVQFRIGVNLGDVMVQGNDLLGDGVNVAARLQTAATPGGICISGSVHDQIRNKLSLTFVALGERSFKNIPEPVRTFSIAAEGVAPRRRRPALPILGTVAVVLAGGVGYWMFTQMPAAPPPHAPEAVAAPAGGEAKPAIRDGAYAGPICYGDGPTKPFCFRAEATVAAGQIAGQWTFANGFTTILSGEISPDGKVRIELRGRDPSGKPGGMSILSGAVDNDRLQAEGKAPSGRDARIDWQRN